MESTVRGTVFEVFRVFLKLGLTSFGGPIAHLGYFRHELVVQRKWLGEADYANLVALCQFLPGPASSQVGFSLGLFRTQTLLGGLAAWLAFTLPSALILVTFAANAALLTSSKLSGSLHGLKLVAVAVVAQALWSMARSLTPDLPRVAIALVAMATTFIVGGSVGQVGAILLGAVAGLWLRREPAAATGEPLRFPVSKRAGTVALILFAALFFLPSVLSVALSEQGVALFNSFYRAGALVFGGGHVVLPLLQEQVITPGWVSNEAFLSGYGFTQAMPGPLFTIAAYLGAIVAPAPNGMVGATIALIAIFLPGLLLVYGSLPFWDGLRRFPSAAGAMRGANAAVVGILAAALYTPVGTGAIVSVTDFAVALAGFLLLMTGRVSPWMVVLVLAVAGTLLHM